MSFNPSGLPTLPNCESDINRWAADLQTWLVAKLTAAHNEIDGITVDPFDICTVVGDLSAPSCLVPAAGINTPDFTYATETGTVTPGVLPWPGSVLTLGISMSKVRQGTVTGTVESFGKFFRADFASPLNSDDFFINVECGTVEDTFIWGIRNRSRSGFDILARANSSVFPQGSNPVTWRYTVVELG
jgi:hypothetical protein